MKPIVGVSIRHARGGARDLPLFIAQRAAKSTRRWITAWPSA
jgi:hypothetical protein